MRLAVALAVISVAGGAFANGRPAASVSVALEPPPGQRVLVGTTFGLLASKDGWDWRWICEQAIYVTGTPGASDPKYLISPAGTWFAALTNGLSVSRDQGCSWQLVGPPLAGAWIKDIAVDPMDPQTLYVATSTTATPNGLFLSHDDGRTWSAVTPLDSVAFYWRVVAQGADAYLSGYDDIAPGHQHLWKYSGASGTIAPQQATGLEAAAPILLYLAASQRAPGLLFLQGKVGSDDAIFRSLDGGQSFTQIHQAANVWAALLDDNDTLWLSSGQTILSSTDHGTTFQTGSTDRVLTCLGKRGATLYGCIKDPAGYVLDTSSDGTHWTGVLRFADIAGPASCPAGSLTHDVCLPLWPSLATQFGIVDAGAGELPDGGAARQPMMSDGGCSVGHGFAIGAGVILLFAVVSAFSRRRRDPSGGPS